LPFVFFDLPFQGAMILSALKSPGVARSRNNLPFQGAKPKHITTTTTTITTLAFGQARLKLFNNSDNNYNNDNPLTFQPFNFSTFQPFNFSTFQPFNFSTLQLFSFSPFLTSQNASQSPPSG
jgi:hypothetical protein